MKRIICHWTAGGYKATSVDRKHYHFIFEGDGNEVAGIFPVSANRRCVKGKYAAHTLRCNTGSIGLSVACMRGAVERPLDVGRSPMTQTQWKAMCRKAARLCIEYGIEVTPRTVLSHAEVQTTLGIKQRGKWDFTVLPFAPHLAGADQCGERLRADIRREISRFGKPPSYEAEILSEQAGTAPGTRAAMEGSWERSDALDHLRQNGSRTIKSGDMLDKVSVAGASATGAVYALGELTDALKTLPAWLLPLLVVGGFIAVFWYVRKIKSARIDDHLTGAHGGRPQNPEYNINPGEFTGENL